MAIDRVEVALAQREVVDEAFGRELTGDPGAVVDREATRRELVHAHAVANDQVAAELFTDSADDLAGEAQAVLEAAAVGVASLIAERGDELLDQMALRAVDFHAVDAAVNGVACRADEAGDDVPDLGRRHLGRHAATVGTRDGRGRPHRRHQAAEVLPATVVELRDDQPALGVDAVAATTQSGDAAGN